MNYPQRVITVGRREGKEKRGGDLFAPEPREEGAVPSPLRLAS